MYIFSKYILVGKSLGKVHHSIVIRDSSGSSIRDSERVRRQQATTRLPALPLRHHGLGWIPGSDTFLLTCCRGCDYPHGCGIVLEVQQQGQREEESRGWQC